jgi:hypothetical protein
MPPLLTPRKGWENEKLASYLLSRLSFVASPTSIADDVGSDFFCTLFEIETANGVEVVLPRSSFAIQVKSSADKISVDNKIDYFNRLELPFFIGVVSQSPPEMRVYSAEFLPILFSREGPPTKFSLVPVSSTDFDRDKQYEVGGSKGILDVRLKCPLVATLRVADDRRTLNSTVSTLLQICSRAHANISTRRLEEHVFNLDGNGRYQIVAGSGSYNYFRGNFLKRLAEVFYNLKWIVMNKRNEFSTSEFQQFQSLYLYALTDSTYPQADLSIVTQAYNDLKATMVELSAE